MKFSCVVSFILAFTLVAANAVPHVSDIPATIGRGLIARGDGTFDCRCEIQPCSGCRTDEAGAVVPGTVTITARELDVMIRRDLTSKIISRGIIACGDGTFECRCEIQPCSGCRTDETGDIVPKSVTISAQELDDMIRRDSISNSLGLIAAREYGMMASRDEGDCDCVLCCGLCGTCFDAPTESSTITAHGIDGGINSRDGTNDICTTPCVKPCPCPIPADSDAALADDIDPAYLEFKSRHLNEDESIEQRQELIGFQCYPWMACWGWGHGGRVAATTAITDIPEEEKRYSLKNRQSLLTFQCLSWMQCWCLQHGCKNDQATDVDISIPDLKKREVVENREDTTDA